VRVRILHAGKPALAYARAGVDEYARRLTRYGSYELECLKAGDPATVSAALLERSAGSFRIALDERGEALETVGWAERLGALESDGAIKAVSFLIGAADGHDERLRRESDAVWALSALTLQHELALVVLLEQLYRVASLRRGTPYHR